ncbi:MAG: LytTR family DNA-binding domain-containing protein, partial [Rhodobacteraceae bacterium]|nr:LytTR family DNA-binding domain-containing protein [Paracoccaceae bacterium]
HYIGDVFFGVIVAEIAVNIICYVVIPDTCQHPLGNSSPPGYLRGPGHPHNATSAKYGAMGSTVEVRIGNRVFSVSQIQFITAADHYLDVCSIDGREFLRGRLRDVVQQVSPDLAIVVNRSCILFRAANGVMVRNGRAYEVRLPDGQVITCSRDNVAKVKSWFEMNETPQADYMYSPTV